ncbi:hypothetical protein J6590_056293 [Homalodisca vitripennis]|nr:hypothetical protein J6590_056293 [Homalodisca vitripennis]
MISGSKQRPTNYKSLPMWKRSKPQKFKPRLEKSKDSQNTNNSEPPLLASVQPVVRSSAVNRLSKGQLRESLRTLVATCDSAITFVHLFLL